MTEARRGFFPIVTGENVSVTQGGGVVFAARNDLTVTEGGGRLFAAGGNATVTQGGAGVLACGGSLTITQGGGLVAVSPQIEARQSTIGVALAARVAIADDSRLVLGTVQAAALGAACGIVCALLGRLLRR